ncbi:DUF1343 domain-containing protein [Dokdonia sinensis]|uniref:DUF1343 domain-containing protein n=1 Tax=Dokdonia sinensis TaxID=2479847 RepID=A0A3M0GUV6_9FLAO|nr:DUF1343 domain-containing protein [Dokdonia sinensis]RMB61106.1 DUF1343 domain-containing protein [Dokdonia sinensis]
MLPLLISCGNNVGGSDNAFAKADSFPQNSKLKIQDSKIADSSIIVGANRIDEYLPLLQNKKVGIVTNQSGLIFKSYPHNKENATHIVDSLIARDIEVIKIFSPEHGFRGDGDAGEKIKDGKDPKTGLPIISLHGKNRKPSQEQLDGLDIIVFDIQDVGVRFYTYISTLTHVMEATAEKGVPVIVLDRPNPNAHYIDGPTLQKQHSSFLGMHEIPLVYGMTIGEYARMVNGEGWLKDKMQCELTVIPLENWSYQSKYSLPTRPSPNLPNDKSINLYPSLGFFEGTTINAGRGTEMQFQVFGSPHLPKEYYPFTYTPEPNFGSKDPKEKGNLCYGLDLRNEPYLKRVNLEWLVEAYNASNDKVNFFKTDGFTLHAGTTELEKQIKEGYTFREIRKGWFKDIESFKKTRAKYLIYE